MSEQNKFSFFQSLADFYNGKGKAVSGSERLTNSLVEHKSRLNSLFIKSETKSVENAEGSVDFSQKYIFNENVIYEINGKATADNNGEENVCVYRVNSDNKHKYKHKVCCIAAVSLVVFAVVITVLFWFESAYTDLIHPYLLIHESIKLAGMLSLAVTLACVFYYIYLSIYKNINLSDVKSEQQISEVTDLNKLKTELEQTIYSIHYANSETINNYAKIDLSDLTAEYKSIFNCSLDALSFSNFAVNENGEAVVKTVAKLTVTKLINNKTVVEVEKVYLDLAVSNSGWRINKYVSNSMSQSVNEATQEKAVIAGKNSNAKKTVAKISALTAILVLLFNLTSVRVICRDIPGCFVKNYNREFFINYEFVPSITNSKAKVKEVKSKYKSVVKGIDPETGKKACQRVYYFRYSGELTDVLQKYAVYLGKNGFGKDRITDNDVTFTQTYVKTMRKAKIGKGIIVVEIKPENGLLKILVKNVY